MPIPGNSTPPCRERPESAAPCHGSRHGCLHVITCSASWDPWRLLRPCLPCRHPSRGFPQLSGPAVWLSPAGGVIPASRRLASTQLRPITTARLNPRKPPNNTWPTTPVGRSPPGLIARPQATHTRARGVETERVNLWRGQTGQATGDQQPPHCSLTLALLLLQLLRLR